LTTHKFQFELPSSMPFYTMRMLGFERPELPVKSKGSVNTEKSNRMDGDNFDLAKVTRLYNFTGQVAVITGGTGVLGGEIAGALAALGAQVVILGRNLKAGEKIRQRLGSRGKIELVYCDVLDITKIKTAAESVVEKLHGIDILVNAAGGNQSKATINSEQTFFDLQPDVLRSVFDLNLMGTLLPCQIFGRIMADRGRGIILNVTSMAATRPLTKVGAYGAAKAAISNFTQWLAVHLAQEYSPYIRVNAIAPGFLRTEQNRFLLTDKETGELTPRGKVIIEHTPMGRFGSPEDLLGAVLWLLSPASSFVTGAVVPVDGGFGAYSGV
jgi:NAD(P)-dependent dehydrogenase (short-subunit alcohol dehydrogenase family)